MWNHKALSHSLPSAHSCITPEWRFKSAQGHPHQSGRSSETPNKRHQKLKSAQGAPALVQEKFRDPQQKTSEAIVSSGGARTGLGEVQRPATKDSGSISVAVGAGDLSGWDCSELTRCTDHLKTVSFPELPWVVLVFLYDCRSVHQPMLPSVPSGFALCCFERQPVGHLAGSGCMCVYVRLWGS